MGVVVLNTKKAFPNCYGAGSFTSVPTGGVFHVTSLAASGSGTFADAVSQSNRFIVFDVSGQIKLNNNLNVNRKNNIYVAGYTAPQGGISFTGDGLLNFTECENVILRGFRTRPRFYSEFISSGNNANTGLDSLNLTFMQNTVLDGVSIAWGGDEATSLALGSDNATVQYCLFGDNHKGLILGGTRRLNNDFSKDAINGSLLKCVFSNSGYRYPNTSCDFNEVINNVVHNWSRNLNVTSSRQQPERPVNVNEINNYFQRGQQPTNVFGSSVHEGHWLDLRWTTDINIYTNGNVCNDVFGANDDSYQMYRHRFDFNGDGINADQWDPAHPKYRTFNQFPLIGSQVPITTADEALAELPDIVGLSHYVDDSGNIVSESDALDQKFRDEVNANTHRPYIYNNDNRILQDSFYNNYLATANSTPISNRPGGYYSSLSDIPQYFVNAHGINSPNQIKTNWDFGATQVVNNAGYTAMEMWLAYSAADFVRLDNGAIVQPPVSSELIKRIASSQIIFNHS